MAPYYCFQMEVDPDVDPPLEDQEVLQVLSKILQVDLDLDLAQDPLNPLITDHHFVMDHLMTISKDLHLEEVGEVGLTAEAVVVVEVFATDLLDLEVIRKTEWISIGVHTSVENEKLDKKNSSVNIVAESILKVAFEFSI